MGECRIVLKPHWGSGSVMSMDVSYVFDCLPRQEDEEICRLQLETVTIPGCDPEDFRVRDDLGEVEVETKTTNPYPYILKHWKAGRSLEGTVCVDYRVRPRQLKPQDQCGPYFDFRAEEGGVNGAGLSFLADFDEYQGKISLHWDLEDMPEGSRGVFTFGEGDVTIDGPMEMFSQSYYCAGRIRSIIQGDFGFYWLTEPDFDMDAIAEYTRTLFAGMQEFFHDTESIYRIFVRKDPFPRSGGTALKRSYMFGWNETQPVSVADKQNILAHEMVHNWPHLNDNPYGSTSWYSEGTAEFYSIMLPLRMGLITVDAALEELQKRTDQYYTNPTRHMENLEAARICWQDRRAQRIPYGRGLFFLANTDVLIRRATRGRKSLDDVMLRILEKDREGVVLGNQVFLETVKETAGLDVSADLESMCKGIHFAPLEDGFDGHFSMQETEVPEADTGKLVTSYCWTVR